MAVWKKIIVSGSNAHLNQITASSLTNDNLVIAGVGGALESSGITYDGTILGLGSSIITSTGATSVLSGSFSGSFQGDGSLLTGLVTALNISSSEGTNGSVDLLTQDLTLSAGEGIDISISGQTVTFAGEDASDTNKGIASFDSGDFVASSGNITLADSANGAVLSITPTANETTVSRTNGTVQIGLPDDVTIAGLLTAATGSIQQDLGVGGNLTVTGDLLVNGATTTISTTNLLVEDRFILLNSGSANPDEGGLVIDEGAGSGHALIYEADLGVQRWGFNESVDSTATTANTTAYAAAVVDLNNGNHSDSAEYQKNGNIKVDTDGEIWIYA
jgi:hypothetical protein